jgi:hypothetical protein
VQSGSSRRLPQFTHLNTPCSSANILSSHMNTHFPIIGVTLYSVYTTDVVMHLVISYRNIYSICSTEEEEQVCLQSRHLACLNKVSKRNGWIAVEESKASLRAYRR